MLQPDAIGIVAEFHEVFQHPILNSPFVPPGRKDLRANLLLEESKEFAEACENNDIVEAADALCDILYVLSGAVLEFGLHHKFKDLFEEVHRSNMSKACSTEEEAIKTVEKSVAEGVPAYYMSRGTKWFVYRSSDSKTIKSINYSPADLVTIINRKD